MLPAKYLENDAQYPLKIKKLSRLKEKIEKNGSGQVDEKLQSEFEEMVTEIKKLQTIKKQQDQALLFFEKPIAIDPIKISQYRDPGSSQMKFNYESEASKEEAKEEENEIKESIFFNGYPSIDAYKQDLTIEEKKLLGCEEEQKKILESKILGNKRIIYPAFPYKMKVSWFKNEEHRPIESLNLNFMQESYAGMSGGPVIREKKLNDWEVIGIILGTISTEEGSFTCSGFVREGCVNFLRSSLSCFNVCSLKTI